MGFLQKKWSDTLPGQPRIPVKHPNQWLKAGHCSWSWGPQGRRQRANSETLLVPIEPDVASRLGGQARRSEANMTLAPGIPEPQVMLVRSGKSHLSNTTQVSRYEQAPNEWIDEGLSGLRFI